MSDNVLPMGLGAPLNDVPGMLRKLADAIEKGTEPLETVFVIAPIADDWPRVYGYGKCEADGSDVIVACELAKTWFLNHKVRRA